MGFDQLPARPLRLAGGLLTAPPETVEDLSPALTGGGEDPFEAHSRFVEANLRRNYAASFIHGVLGMTGFRLLYAPTIIPAYMLAITGSTAAVGLGTALLQFGAIASPIVAGARIEHRSHILPFSLYLGTMMRMAILGLALAAWFLSGEVLVGVTLLFLAVLGYYNGAQRVAFQMMLAKVIPIARRGRLQGYRNLAGGLIAAVVAWAAGRWFIGEDFLGNGYATTFALAFVLTSMGLVAFRLLIREPPSPASRAVVSLRERIRQFPQMLRDHDFGRFVLAQGLASAIRIGGPFWTIYAGQKLGLSGAVIGGLSLAFIGADTLSNLVWGPMGDRFGFRLVFLLAIAATMGGIAVLLLAATSATAFYCAFVLLGAGASGWMLAATTMVLEFGDHEDIPMRIAFVTTAEGIIASIGPIAAGLLVAAAGFGILFDLVLAALAAALLVMLLGVREPRGRLKADAG